MALYVLLITDEWKTKRDQLYASYGGNKTNEFDDFCMAYSKHCSDLKPLGIDALTIELSRIGVKNDRIVKVFDSFYVWTGLKDTDNCRKHITGFCDVTGFLLDIKTVYEREYCIEALKQFMHYGGIIRINDNDLVYDEVDTLEKLVKDNTPNIK